MVGQQATRVGRSSAWARRARLAGIVVAASAVAAVSAFVQACRGGNAHTAAPASAGSGRAPSPGPAGTEPPVTIVIQPPPPTSTSAEPLRLDLSSELPEPAPPKPSAGPPRRGKPDDSGVIYE